MYRFHFHLLWYKVTPVLLTFSQLFQAFSFSSTAVGLVNDNTWNIIHTGVRNEYQGQGIARKLIECVIENANDLNKKVIAECSYAKKVINNDLKNIVKQYLEVFPEEKERQNMINDYLSSTSDPFDWDDFNGHLVAGGIIYAEKEKKFHLSLMFQTK